MVTALDRLPRTLLHGEGVALATATAVVYFDGGHRWWLFLALLPAPDLAMLAYLAGARLGALAYDLAHTLVLPIVLGTIGITTDTGPATAVSLIWLAHIGVDRAIGYGLKYRTGFRDTHLQRV